jgi:DNA-binding NarL/FixJ family response regulator
VIRVVIADDASDIRMLVRMTLSMDDRFAVVGEAGDGLETLVLLDETSPDALLLDLAMPNMDGLEVLERLSSRPTPPPVVVFSGFSSQAMIDRALALGASAYIDKGADLSSVPTVLADAVARNAKH